ncbi:MAG: D-alanyl-D-alanine carboxypeptidase [Firmicutes bacterium]|nr:D-alanyl-D-alanine carboxypeptidase [Bacillota bacterium]
MKKLLFMLLFLIPIKVFSISASSAIAMDLDTGRVLYGYNIEEKKLIASTTKIMTAIVAIENSDISQEIEVSDVIYEAYGSAIYIEVGEKIILKDLLYGLMLRSGNDASLAIAEAVSGSEEEFVYLMNEYAANLNMKNTIFYNPHGLEESNGDANKSTTLDMAKLTKYAMQNDTFREIFKTQKHTVKTNYKTYVWHNKNKLLSLDYITGGKTGYTELARRTLVTTGSKDNINLVVVTLNDPNDWDDHKTIYEQTFQKYKSYELFNQNNFKVEEDDYYKEDKLYIKNDYNMTLTKDELKKVSLNINLMKLEDYIDDTMVGYIEVILDNQIFHKEPIYVKVQKENLEKLSWWQKFKRWLF